MKSVVIAIALWFVPWGTLSIALAVLGYPGTGTVVAVASLFGWGMVLGLCNAASEPRTPK